MTDNPFDSLSPPSASNHQSLPRPRAIYAVTACGVILWCSFMIAVSVGECSCFSIFLPFFCFVAWQQFQATFRRNATAAIKIAVALSIVGVVCILPLLACLILTIHTQDFQYLLPAGIFLLHVVLGFTANWMNRQWARFLWAFPNEREEEKNASSSDLGPRYVYGPPLQYFIGTLLWITVLVAIVMSLAATLAGIGGPPR